MLRVMAIASFILIAGCHRQADAPGDAPTGLSVTEGEGQVVVTWDQLPGLTYWIFFRPGSDVSPAAIGVPAIFDTQSPRIVSGLANATQYAFVMNATNQDSRAGPSSPVATAFTRLAGNSWASGGVPSATLATPQNLNGVAYGVVPVAGISTARLVVVGDGGTIFAGDYSYTNYPRPCPIPSPCTSTDPIGVTSWTQATALLGTIPPNFNINSNLTAVIYTGQFVALGNDGSILMSGDSNTWTSPTTSAPIPTNGATMNGLTLGVSAPTGTLVYVAVGTGGSIFTNFTSTDNLITWRPQISNTSNDLFSVSYLPVAGLFVATGANGTLLTSTDAITWNQATISPPTSKALRGTAFGLVVGTNSVFQTFVVVGEAGTILVSTNGGSNFGPPSPPPAISQDLLSVVFDTRSLPNVVSGARFVAVGRGGTVAYSDDGNSWPPVVSAGSADLTAIARIPAAYIAVGASGANAVSE